MTATSTRSASRRFTRRLSSVFAGLAAVAGATVLALAPAGGASAHDYLVSSQPTADSMVSETLPQVTLTFDDIVLDEGGHGALVQVTDASGRNFETGCATVDGREVSVPVALGASGAYRVTWQIVSADGHPVSSSIQFSYAGPKAGDGRDGPLAKCGTTVKAPAATGAAAPTANGGAQQSAQDALVPVIIVVAVVVVLLVVVAIVLIVLLGGRRRKGTETRTPE